MARFSGTQAYQTEPFGVPDDFDAWSAARERGLMNSPSGDYVPPDMPGTQDLDSNGTWELTPDYGYVWAPLVVAAGWAPYRFGHWAFIPPWGWTWIDDAAWGFAPYHYGRWVQWNSAWCWVPGPRRVHPVYAPAMVGWVGGPGRHPGALAANVGWFPLGPHEVYVPPYAVSPRYARAVNLTNTVVTSTNVTDVYQNNGTDLRYRNNTPAAVTAVPQGAFASGAQLRGRAVALTAAALADAGASASAPAIMPQRASPTTAVAASVAHPPPAYLNRPVLARTPPPRAPVPFERQLAAMQANGGSALARPALARLQPDVAAGPVRILAAGSKSPLPVPAAAAAAAASAGAASLRNERPPPGVAPPPVTSGSAATAARTGATAGERYRAPAPLTRTAPPAPSSHAPPAASRPPRTRPRQGALPQRLVHSSLLAVLEGLAFEFPDEGTHLGARAYAALEQSLQQRLQMHAQRHRQQRRRVGIKRAAPRPVHPDIPPRTRHHAAPPDCMGHPCADVPEDTQASPSQSRARAFLHKRARWRFPSRAHA